MGGQVPELMGDFEGVYGLYRRYDREFELIEAGIYELKVELISVMGYEIVALFNPPEYLLEHPLL